VKKGPTEGRPSPRGKLIKPDRRCFKLPKHRGAERGGTSKEEGQRNPLHLGMGVGRIAQKTALRERGREWK